MFSSICCLKGHYLFDNSCTRVDGDYPIVKMYVDMACSGGTVRCILLCGRLRWDTRYRSMRRGLPASSVESTSRLYRVCPLPVSSAYSCDVYTALTQYTEHCVPTDAEWTQASVANSRVFSCVSPSAAGASSCCFCSCDAPCLLIDRSACSHLTSTCSLSSDAYPTQHELSRLNSFSSSLSFIDRVLYL